VTVAYIGGTFDLFHYGHVRLFRRAKENFDRVVVSVNRDDFVARFKLRLPILNLEERMELVQSCRYVDETIVNLGDEDSRPGLIIAGATHFIHGSDWTGPGLLKQLGVTQEWLTERGIKMVYFPYTQEISTSKLLERAKGVGLR
jgi:cytidyltransferase-like protein